MKQTPKINSLSFKDFLRDRFYFFLTAFIFTLIAASFLNALHVRAEVIIIITFLWILFLVIVTLFEYFRKKSFYNNLLENIKHFDQAYLVLETLAEPDFYDGEILYRALYDINKSIAENINLYRTQIQEFRDYVEMWIHEVKTPLATLALITRDPKSAEQIKRLDDYLEQILYFTRAENAERDYLIKKNNLADVINVVASRNREILLQKHIDFKVRDLDQAVYTDAKWLEFILNQIISNSIKYRSTTIQISARRAHHETFLTVEDNGIGIDPKDLPRVFEKTFTGNNGRISQHSTGMGLYIAKTLCTKLGHRIAISSEKNNYTKLTITFSDPEYYNVVDNETYKNVINL